MYSEFVNNWMICRVDEENSVSSSFIHLPHTPPRMNEIHDVSAIWTRLAITICPSESKRLFAADSIVFIKWYTIYHHHHHHWWCIIIHHSCEIVGITIFSQFHPVNDLNQFIFGNTNETVHLPINNLHIAVASLLRKQIHKSIFLNLSQIELCVRNIAMVRYLIAHIRSVITIQVSQQK